MKRAFRHEGEGRSWWIETSGRELRIGFSGDDDPADVVQRTRREATVEAAEKECARLVAEQLAEGFVESGATARQTAMQFFDQCLARWQTASPTLDASVWLRAVADLAPTMRDRIHDELIAVGPPSAWKDATWLRMQAPHAPAPFLLVLRDPGTWAFALWVLDGFVVPPPLVGRLTWLGALEHAPTERAPLLEEALMSLVEHPPESESAASFVALTRFPWSAASLARLVRVAEGSDAARAYGALSLLARGHLDREDVRAVMRAFLARPDGTEGQRIDLARIAVPALGGTGTATSAALRALLAG